MDIGMNPTDRHVLVLNCGSSSIRYALFQTGSPPLRRLHGLISRIGKRGPTMSFTDAVTGQVDIRVIAADNHDAAAKVLFGWLADRQLLPTVQAVGHRVVFGMQHTAPEMVTDELLDHLRAISRYDPEHLPVEIHLMEMIQGKFPVLPQVACFDSDFHRDLPQAAKMLPIPRRYFAQGVRRYGFHGLSYAYLMDELVRQGDPAASQGRVVLAHLGNGASLAAVANGVGIDTSMGFTPTSGIPMGSRSGDLDPGLAAYFARSESMTTDRFQYMMNHESGLLGVSETTSDMQDLLDVSSSDPRAAEAVTMFCYYAKKCLGSYAAALGGLDTLVFAGGIGEHAPIVRDRICAGLGFMGIDLDQQRNERSEAVVSTDNSRVTIRVIHTDEEVVIARAVLVCCPVGEHPPADDVANPI
jgi:acetate kinase